MVCCGDLAAGPLPDETVEALLSADLPLVLVRGNADRELVERLDEVHGRAMAGTPWDELLVTRAHRDLLAGLPLSVVLDVEGLGPVRFCHATPRDDTEVLLPTTPGSRVEAALDGVAEAVVVGGHVHLPFDRHTGRHRLVNTGSVGMPYGRTGASWALLGPDVALRHTVYDLPAAAREITERSTWSLAADFAEGNVLTCPSEEEALAAFGGSR